MRFNQLIDLSVEELMAKTEAHATGRPGGRSVTTMEMQEAQMRRLEYLLADRWVTEDDRESEELFVKILAEIKCPIELHQFAANFNWDGGHSELEKVLQHPKCDLGTAIMIYFLGNPQFLYVLQERKMPFIGEQSSLFSFLKRIEMLRENDALSINTISFDPANAFGRNFLLRQGTHLIPEFMKHPTPGENVEILKLR